MTDTDMYTCDECGATHEKGWTDAEATAEMVANFGELDADDIAVVCDDCYRKMVAWKDPADWMAEQP